MVQEETVKSFEGGGRADDLISTQGFPYTHSSNFLATLVASVIGTKCLKNSEKKDGEQQLEEDSLGDQVEDLGSVMQKGSKTKNVPRNSEKRGGKIKEKKFFVERLRLGHGNFDEKRLLRKRWKRNSEGGEAIGY